MFGTAAAASPSVDPGFAPGRLLLVARPGLSDAEVARILTAHRGSARRVGKSQILVVDLPAGSEKAAAAVLSRNPHFKSVELDQRVAPHFVSNDPYLSSEWHLSRIGAPTAWDTSSGAGVTIAILDTGVDGTHPDLATQMVPGWNFYDNNANTSDVYGHGTKVAGTAAATMNNGAGVAGVSGSARIMPIRISDTSGIGYWSLVAQGLTWAADNGARVANVSYGVAGSSTVQSAAQYMKNKGGLVFVSAGNSGAVDTTTPTTTLIPVSATDSNDLVTSWSTYGTFVALSAPGAGIYTTTSGGGYGAPSGTSFSSPVSAGVAALVMAARPTLGSGDVETILYKSAVDLGASGRDPYYGYGRVSADGAVRMASTYTTVVDSTPPTVAVAAPLAGSTVSGVVAVDVSATDNVGVAKVELSVNGAVIATDTGSPYGFSWDTTAYANGAATLVATAYDAAGNRASSSSVSVNVSNAVVGTTAADTTPPTISLTNPQAGTVVSATAVTISTYATDDSGAAGIKQSLFIDGKLVATATGSTLSYRWNTKKLSSGAHTVTATAQDAAGNTSSTSAQVTR